MRALLLALVVLAPLVVAHDSGECPARGEYVIRGDGGEGTLWHVDYERDFDFTGDDWLYLETGALPGVQTGADQVLVGTLWVHDHRCVHHPLGQRDKLVY